MCPVMLPIQSAEGVAQSDEWDLSSIPPIRKLHQGLQLKKGWAILILVTSFGLGWLIWLGYKEFERDEEERAHAAARDPGRLAWLLPPNLTLDTEFADSPNTVDSALNRATTTIREKLREIGAYCKGGVIYDSQGRKVVFRRISEWGCPPKDGDLIRWQEVEEIRKLKAEGVRVIVMWSTQVLL
jgi:hypothetical protein